MRTKTEFKGCSAAGWDSPKEVKLTGPRAGLLGTSLVTRTSRRLPRGLHLQSVKIVHNKYSNASLKSILWASNGSAGKTFPKTDSFKSSSDCHI